MPKIAFENQIVVLGFGSVAQAVLPLIGRHFDEERCRIKILAKEIMQKNHSQLGGIEFCEVELTRSNYKSILSKEVSAGDLVVNLTAGVSSLDLARFCSENGVLYLDTCIELWTDEISPNCKTYDDRERWQSLRDEFSRDSTTSLSSMGANPGIVSLLTKRLIEMMAAEHGILRDLPASKDAWASLAKRMTVQVIHINERDTQISEDQVGPQDFFSTWSVEAMIIECIEPGEMAIGSHENGLPEGAGFSGEKNTRDIHFSSPGKDVKIKTWLPLAGEQVGMALNHSEPLSLAELFSQTTKDGDYSPTVCFVYHPCDQAMRSIKNLTKENYLDFSGRLMKHEIVDGHDELGVFIMTAQHSSYWLGSRLDIHTAREINPESSATSLQVAGGVIAGMCWIVTNPKSGFVEPEDISDHDYVLDVAENYWGGFWFERSNWRPGRNCSKQGLRFENFVTKTDR